MHNPHLSNAGVPLDHEAFVAGALLIDPARTLRETRGLLTPESFESETYQAIFSAALELEREGIETDVSVLKRRVERNGAELSNEVCRDLMNAVPTLQALPFYAERVAEDADARNLKAVFLDAYQRLTSGDILSSVKGDVERALTDIKQRGSAALVSSGEAMKSCYEGLLTASGGEKLFVGTGYGKLNRILGGGYIKAGLHILAARPGTGKTTLALQIAENVAAKGIKTLFISLEMGVDQLQHRRIAMDAGVSLGDILQIAPEDTETWRKIAASSAKLSPRPLLFNNLGQLSVDRIERLARASEAKFVVIDYLGLIHHAGGKSIYEKVTETSGALKRMAISLNIPVLCLCQLNRAADGKAPQLSELRDSGAIEQDADTVCLQWIPGGRPDDGYIASSTPVELQLIVAKNRHGAQGKLSLDWYMNCGRIRE